LTLIINYTHLHVILFLDKCVIGYSIGRESIPSAQIEILIVYIEVCV